MKEKLKEFYEDHKTKIDDGLAIVTIGGLFAGIACVFYKFGQVVTMDNVARGMTDMWLVDPEIRTKMFEAEKKVTKILTEK